MRSVVLAVAACVVLGAGAIGPVAADAAPVSSCTSAAGTIVAVDYAHWGGPVVRGCDTTHPKTGADLLTDSGFRLSGTQHDGPAFVCRIGNRAFRAGRQYPTANQDACVLTPPATAYWSYWLAAPGANRWTYSSWGAYAPQRQPEVGGVELWIFGGTRTTGSQGTPTDGFPICSPDSLRSGGSPARCTPRGPARSRPNARKSSLGRGDGAEKPSREPSSSAAPTPTTEPSSSPTSAPREAPGATAPAVQATYSHSSSAVASPTLVEASPASAHPSSKGSVVPLVSALGLVVVLLAGGGVAVWRRRRGVR